MFQAFTSWLLIPKEILSKYQGGQGPCADELPTDFRSGANVFAFKGFLVCLLPGLEFHLNRVLNVSVISPAKNYGHVEPTPSFPSIFKTVTAISPATTPCGQYMSWKTIGKALWNQILGQTDLLLTCVAFCRFIGPQNLPCEN